VAVGIAVDFGVGVAVGLGLGVTVGLGVRVGVAVGSGSGEAVGIAVHVGVSVGLEVQVAVLVGTDTLVGVASTAAIMVGVSTLAETGVTSGAGEAAGAQPAGSIIRATPSIRAFPILKASSPPQVSPALPFSPPAHLWPCHAKHLSCTPESVAPLPVNLRNVQQLKLAKARVSDLVHGAGQQELESLLDFEWGDGHHDPTAQYLLEERNALTPASLVK
jgi:hypothetical protein